MLVDIHRSDLAVLSGVQQRTCVHLRSILSSLQS